MLLGWNRSDTRFVGLCLVLALGSGIEAWRDFGRAFPEARIEFQVNRRESRQLAAEFVGSLGYDVASWKQAALFHFDDDQKVFLERNLGADSAAALCSATKLWRWSHRWFRPHQKEEFTVEVTPGGAIAGFERLLPEEAAGDSLSEPVARAVAEAFVAAHTRLDLSTYEFVEATSVRLPARIDHTFTWKRSGVEVHGATVRLRVEVDGGAVGGFEEFLHVPDEWLHDYERLRARNESANLVAAVLALVTGLAMLLVLVLRIRDRDVRWRSATSFGLVAFVLQLLAALNELGLARYDYPTEQGYLGYMVWQVVVGLLGASATGGLVLLLTAAAEPVYREQYPDKLALEQTFGWRGLGTRAAFRQIVLGITLAFFFVAYQTVFYLVAARFGAWAPLDVPYDNMLNTGFPWAMVLVAGFLPAVSEEFSSRMFSVPFFSRLFHRGLVGRRAAVVLAVVVSSFIWGFGHAGYPNQPFYIRGVEVGVAGMLTAWVMLRWGILATLVWHYSIDACYTALLMLRSGDSYLQVSGAAAAGILLVPLGLSLGRVWRRGGFEPEAGLCNADLPGPHPAPAEPGVEEARVVAVEPVPRRRILVGAAVALALLCLYFVPIERPAAGTAVRQGRATARAAALAHARQAGVDPDSFRVAVCMQSLYDAESAKYVLEHGGIGALNRLYGSALSTPVWDVRLFRPEALEELRLSVPVSGEAVQGEDATRAPLVGIEHVLPENAPGDTLSVDAARAVAERFLHTQGRPVQNWTLMQSGTEERSARTDHTFEWEDTTLVFGAARPRTTVVVQGGRIGKVDAWLHVPEEWSRAYRERTLLERLAWVLARTLIGAGVFLVVLLFVGSVRTRRFPWRRALGWGGVAAVLALVTFALEWETRVAASYPTATPWALFRLLAGSMAGVRGLFYGTMTAMLMGTLLALRPETRALLAGRPSTSKRDAMLLALVGIATLVGLRQVMALVQAAAPAHIEFSEFFSVDAAALPLPWLHELAALAQIGLIALPLFGLVAHLATETLGVRRFAIVVAAGVVFLAGGRTHDPLTWGIGALLLALRTGGLLWLACYLLRRHDLAYVLTFVAAFAGHTLFTWVRQPEPGLRLAALVFAFGLVVGAVVCLRWGSRRQPARARWSSATEGKT